MEEGSEHVLHAARLPFLTAPLLICSLSPYVSGESLQGQGPVSVGFHQGEMPAGFIQLGPDGSQAFQGSGINNRGAALIAVCLTPVLSVALISGRVTRVLFIGPLGCHRTQGTGHADSRQLSNASIGGSLAILWAHTETVTSAVLTVAMQKGFPGPDTPVEGNSVSQVDRTSGRTRGKGDRR